MEYGFFVTIDGMELKLKNDSLYVKTCACDINFFLPQSNKRARYIAIQINTV